MKHVISSISSILMVLVAIALTVYLAPKILDNFSPKYKTKDQFEKDILLYNAGELSSIILVKENDQLTYKQYLDSMYIVYKRTVQNKQSDFTTEDERDREAAWDKLVTSIHVKSSFSSEMNIKLLLKSYYKFIKYLSGENADDCANLAAGKNIPMEKYAAADEYINQLRISYIDGIKTPDLAEIQDIDKLYQQIIKPKEKLFSQNELSAMESLSSSNSDTLCSAYTKYLKIILDANNSKSTSFYRLLLRRN
ncbi:hypothetical protein [Oleomonas cavernae]|uniref:hypothetical protein n=1 Tax=Oleomonas cavernae TaxID=2320859 RepID=UPI0011C3D847|nr:hypothetical protein [Oleomonas cavernae]